MRSGRIDETSHSAGAGFDHHHYERSFEIFNAVAKDLKISEKKSNTKVAVPKDVSLCPT